jgi:hypothetical protein
MKSPSVRDSALRASAPAFVPGIYFAPDVQVLIDHVTNGPNPNTHSVPKAHARSLDQRRGALGGIHTKHMCAAYLTSNSNYTRTNAKQLL